MVEPNSKGGSDSCKRNKRDVVGNMMDMISELPDEILVSIVSLLPLKEAQATSILAKRWQYVWAYCTNLNFDDYKNLCRLHELNREARELTRCRYVSWVDSVLKQHRALNIEQFRICFNLEPKSRIDEWIRLAMGKGVQMLELDFSAFSYLNNERYIFSNKGLGISETSTLKYSSCAEYIGSKCLKDLVLKYVDVDQEVLECFMLNCPVLQRLAVYDSSSLVNLRVVGQSIALKHLTIQSCRRIGIIEIRDANLVSFTYDSYVRKLVLSNLPLLVEVSVGGWPAQDSLKTTLFHLSDCFSRLEILRLSSQYNGEREPVIPSLPNLKRLELAINHCENYALLRLASFIKKSPYMHTLVLRLSQGWSKKSPFAKKRAAKCFHDRLKVIKIVEYTGLSPQIELVKYLMKTASNLKTIVFDPVNPWRSRFDRGQDWVVKQEELSRAQAQQLKEKLPATLEVVCL